MKILKKIAVAIKAFRESAKNTKPLYRGYQPITERPPTPTEFHSVFDSQESKPRKR